MEYRIPPQNVEAEQSLLGAMLLDKKAIMEAVHILNDDDFYREEHKVIFNAILDLYNTNKEADMVTVSNKPGINISYLAQITSNCPTSTNAKHYAGIVKGKSLRRKLILNAQEVVDLAYDGIYENIIDLKNDALQKMDIDIKDHKQEQSSIKDITVKTLSIIEGRYRSTDTNKMFFEFPWLDKMTGGAHMSELTILAARPSIGKTAFANQIGINLAKKDNYVAIFNLEMDKQQLNERMISNESGVDGQRIRYGKNLTDADWEKIGNAAGEVMEYNINIFDSVFKIEEIRGRCRDLKNKDKLDFVIVDYLQLCETMKKHTGANERVSILSRQFKLMAKELKTPFWVLSQLTRANERDNRRPKLIDLRESGSIEQDADNVFFLHDEQYGKYEAKENNGFGSPIELIIAKQRNGMRDIYHEIKFRRDTQRFYE